MKVVLFNLTRSLYMLVNHKLLFVLFFIVVFDAHAPAGEAPYKAKLPSLDESPELVATLWKQADSKFLLEITSLGPPCAVSMDSLRAFSFSMSDGSKRVYTFASEQNPSRVRTNGTYVFLYRGPSAEDFNVPARFRLLIELNDVNRLDRQVKKGDELILELSTRSMPETKDGTIVLGKELVSKVVTTYQGPRESNDNK
jgi:hypothetical protein